MKTTIYVGVSLDGYIARKNGEIDWLAPFQSDEVATSYRDFCETIDVFVIGRGTFETALSFPAWPYDKQVIVLSSTLRSLPDDLHSRVELASAPPRSLLSGLSRRGFTSAYVDGGKVIQSFLREDCIDEMILTRVPLLLGGGIPLFGELSQALRFTHAESVSYKNGLVKSRYLRFRNTDR